MKEFKITPSGEYEEVNMGEVADEVESVALPKSKRKRESSQTRQVVEHLVYGPQENLEYFSQLITQLQNFIDTEKSYRVKKHQARKWQTSEVALVYGIPTIHLLNEPLQGEASLWTPVESVGLWLLMSFSYAMIDILTTEYRKKKYGLDENGEAIDFWVVSENLKKESRDLKQAQQAAHNQLVIYLQEFGFIPMDAKLSRKKLLKLCEELLETYHEAITRRDIRLNFRLGTPPDKE